MALPIVLDRTKALPKRADGSVDVQAIDLKPGDLVRVKNNDSHTYEFRWNNLPYRVPAGGEGMMPFECAASWFGDPRSSTSIYSTRDSNNLVGFVPDRETELRRIKMKYGVMGAPENELGEAGSYPDVELYDVDGNRVLTVLDDPSGEAALPVPQPLGHNVSDLTAQISNLQRQVQALSASIATSQADAGEKADVTVPAESVTENPTDPFAADTASKTASGLPVDNA